MAELSSLLVKIQGDNSDFRAAVQGSISDLRQFGQESNKAITSAAAGSAKLTKSYSNMRASIDPVYAAQKQYNSELRTLNILSKAGVVSAQEFSQIQGNLQQKLLASAGAMDLHTGQIRNSRFHTANLAAQFNDIGVMLAAGQSPFMLAIQQGTQMTQVFAAMGGTVKQNITAMRTAIASMITPMSLMTIGGIAAIAMLVKWGRSAFSAGEATNELAEQIAGITKEMREGELALRQYEEGFRRLSSSAAQTRIDEINAEIVALSAEIIDFTNRGIDAYDRLAEERMNQIRLLEQERAELEETIEASEAQAKAIEIASDNAWGLVDAISSIDFSAAIGGADVFNARLATGLARANGIINAVGGWMQDRAAFVEQSRAAGAGRGGDPRSMGGSFSDWQDTPTGQLGIINNEPPSGGGGGGGGGGADPILSRLESLQESLQTEEEKAIEAYETQQQLLEDALAKRYLTEAEYREQLERLEEQHQDKLVALNAYKYGNALDQTEFYFGEMANAFATGNERMLQISKAFGAAEALINAWRTFSQVMADSSLSWWQKLPAAIALFGQAVSAVNAIKGVGKSGSGQQSVGGGGSAGGGSDPAGGGAMAPQQTRSLTLIGDRFNRQQAIEIAEFMNEGTDNGLVIRGRR